MRSEKRTRKITVRLTTAEYESIEKKCKSAVNSELSYYVRNAILNKPVVIKTRNESLDYFIEELIQLRQELNAIGNNFNQTVKKLHLLKQIPQFRDWIEANESMHQLFFKKVAHIEERIEKIAEQWLQG